MEVAKLEKTWKHMLIMNLMMMSINTNQWHFGDLKWNFLNIAAPSHCWPYSFYLIIYQENIICHPSIYTHQLYIDLLVLGQENGWTWAAFLLFGYFVWLNPWSHVFDHMANVSQIFTVFLALFLVSTNCCANPSITCWHIRLERWKQLVSHQMKFWGD